MSRAEKSKASEGIKDNSKPVVAPKPPAAQPP